jgi:hypothetical protein
VRSKKSSSVETRTGGSGNPKAPFIISEPAANLGSESPALTLSGLLRTLAGFMADVLGKVRASRESATSPISVFLLSVGRLG